MNIRDIPAALHPYRDRGVQHLKGVLDDGLREQLRQGAREIMALREEGRLTTDNQDSQGLGYDWFEPFLTHPQMVQLATSLLGPDVVGAGWRILVKDQRFKTAVHVHQDWPYNFGGVDKITVFVPMTRVNADNGGLVFYEESHLYGPVSRGSIDVSRFPPMTEVCPDAEVGDLIVCDYLTWHYSNTSSNGEERIMLQLNYQPAYDPSSKNLIAGKFPHDKLLIDRWDAAGVPSTELNLPDARRALDSGDLDRANRFARGLLFDDPDHVGGALLMHDLMMAQRDPQALQYLETARTALKKLQRQLAERDAALSGGTVVETAPDTVSDTAANSPWKPLATRFHSYVPAFDSTETLPATFGTPQIAWNYGAVSDPLATDKVSTLRIRARAVGGEVGLCLISEDCSAMASDAHVVKPEDGEASIMIAFSPQNSPARVAVRNHGIEGATGALELTSVDVFEFA